MGEGRSGASSTYLHRRAPPLPAHTERPPHRRPPTCAERLHHGQPGRKAFLCRQVGGWAAVAGCFREGGRSRCPSTHPAALPPGRAERQHSCHLHTHLHGKATPPLPQLAKQKGRTVSATASHAEKPRLHHWTSGKASLAVEVFWGKAAQGLVPGPLGARTGPGPDVADPWCILSKPMLF